MHTTATFPPVPSAIPTPIRGTDLFDFLHDRRAAKAAEPSVKVQENESHDVVAVTVTMSDGRTVCRKVSAECWKQQGYRQALIHNMCTLIA